MNEFTLAVLMAVVGGFAIGGIGNVWGWPWFVTLLVSGVWGWCCLDLAAYFLSP